MEKLESQWITMEKLESHTTPEDETNKQQIDNILEGCRSTKEEFTANIGSANENLQSSPKRYIAEDANVGSPGKENIEVSKITKSPKRSLGSSRRLHEFSASIDDASGLGASVEDANAIPQLANPPIPDNDVKSSRNYHRKSPKRSIGSAKKLYEFGASIDMEDAIAEEEEDDDSDIKLNFPSLSSNKNLLNKNGDTLWTGSVDEADEMMSNEKNSLDVFADGDAKHLSLRKGQRSTSPVYIDELNAKLRERRLLIQSEDSKEEDGDLISNFKGLFNKGDLPVTTTEKDERKDKKGRKSSNPKGEITPDSLTQSESFLSKINKERQALKEKEREMKKQLFKQEESKKDSPMHMKPNIGDSQTDNELKLSGADANVLNHSPTFDNAIIDGIFDVNNNRNNNNNNNNNSNNNINNNNNNNNNHNSTNNDSNNNNNAYIKSQPPSAVTSSTPRRIPGNRTKKLIRGNSSSAKPKLSVSFDDDSVEKSAATSTPVKSTPVKNRRPLSADEATLTSTPKKGDRLVKSAHSSSLNNTYTASPTNSKELKDMIYQQWLENKTIQTKEQMKAKLAAQKKAAKESQAEASERKVVAKKTFEAWNENKTQVLSTQKIQKKETKKTEKEKMEEAVQRKRDAEKYFEKWKENKDEKLKEIHRKKKMEKKSKERERFTEKRQKSMDSLKAFESWKSVKDKDLIEVKKKAKEEKVKAGEEKVLAFEKEQNASRAYEAWKSTKPVKTPSPPKLTQKAWSPASRNLKNAIPSEVQPVVLRNRNVSR